MKLASCKSALNPPVVYSTDRSKAVVPVLVLLFLALWFILRGDLIYVRPYVILFLYFSVLLALRLPRFGKRELILVLFVCLFDLRLFGLVLSVSSSSWCLRRAAVCYCGTPWTFLLPVFLARCGSTIDDMPLAWPAWFNFGFHLLWHTVELAMSTRLCLSL